ncbi:hemoglobin heart muscle subunit alpha-type-like [Dendropsophus ebraccatus]|uniref:hemoglobin heart muscle subunit alpha-type-like n=1 Tax=Dendropsophus ebraccatus TaxID=150705 RepID=UPI003831065B
MALSDAEKALLAPVMAKAVDEKMDIGCTAVTRLINTHEELKPLFSGVDLPTHGGKVVQMLADGVNNLDPVEGQKERHTTDLKLGKEQIMWLLNIFLDIINEKFSSDLDKDVQAAFDKYLNKVACILSSS